MWIIVNVSLFSDLNFFLGGHPVWSGSPAWPQIWGSGRSLPDALHCFYRTSSSCWRDILYIPRGYPGGSWTALIKGFGSGLWLWTIYQVAQNIQESSRSCWCWHVGTYDSTGQSQLWSDTWTTFEPMWHNSGLSVSYITLFPGYSTWVPRY